MTEFTNKGIFPKKKLTLSEWMIKHKVSCHNTSASFAIRDAINLRENYEMY